MPQAEPGKAQDRPWLQTSGLELEDLLDELRNRAEAAKRSQARLGALLDAVVAVSADLELPVVLGRIVRSACQLVDAKYGALGVLGPDREHLSEFVTHGVDEETRAQIGDPPRGHGVLGLLIRDPRARRLKDIAGHPDSYGFPPHHPAMHSFLGTPIRIRDEIFGNLYMAEKQGAKEFTGEDEAMLTALAAAAGVAIENARLYERVLRQQQWSEAIGELTQVLLAGGRESSALAVMTAQARQLSDADLAVVALFDEQADLVIRACECLDRDEVRTEALREPLRLVGGHWGDILSGRGALLLSTKPGETPDEATSTVRALGGLPAHGTTALIPIAVGEHEVGLLGVAWRGDPGVDAAESTASLADFAAQAGLAIEAARAQLDRGRAALLEDRDRIARDMHDHVIQRLFATGLSLQSASRLAVHPMVRARLDDAVDQLDAAIKDIRHTIFELHHAVPVAGLHGEVDELISTAAQSLGFTPELGVEGRLGELPMHLEADVLAVIREGLANVARHARASTARVHIAIADDEVLVEVSDDGVGFDPELARSGVKNLASRAEAHGGTLVVRNGQPSGSTISWRVPLSVPA